MAKEKLEVKEDPKSGAKELGVFVVRNGVKQLFRSYTFDVHGADMQPNAEMVAKREGGTVEKIR